MVTTTTESKLAQEIQKLENDLTTLKRTNIFKLERRVNQLLKVIDDSPSSLEKSKFRERLLTIAATATLTVALIKSPDFIPNFDWFSPKVEQISPSLDTDSAKPELNSASTTTKAEMLEQLMKAIATQESGGNHKIINTDSGASGKWQVMPFNIPSWSKAALGYSVTHAQFMASPELQQQIVKHRLNLYLNQESAPGRSEEEIIRRVASLWYSGRAHLWNNTKPQYSNGQRYPSIAEYTLSVWQKYQAKKNSPDIINKNVIYSWATQWQEDPKAGDKIAGYVVTSPRGWRYHPISGKRTFHQGVDLGTPMGTPLYAIASGNVRCWEDSGGGGLVASFTSDKFPGLQFDLLHLSECVQTKSVSAGVAIAKTGNSGASTGPHLDLRIKDLATGKRLRVRSGWLHWFLTGVKP